MKKGILVILFLGLYVSSAFAGYRIKLINENVLTWDSCNSYIDAESFFELHKPNEQGKLLCGAVLRWNDASGYLHIGDMCVPQKVVNNVTESDSIMSLMDGAALEKEKSEGGSPSDDKEKSRGGSAKSWPSDDKEAEEACRSGVMRLSIGGGVVTEINHVEVANRAMPIFNLFVNVERGDGGKLTRVVSCAVHKSQSSGDWITTFKVEG